MDGILRMDENMVVVLLSWFAPSKVIIAVGVAASLKNRFSAADILKNMPASLGVRGGGKQSFAQGSFSGEYDAMQQFQVDITSALIAMV